MIKLEHWKFLKDVNVLYGSLAVFYMMYCVFGYNLITRNKYPWNLLMMIGFTFSLGCAMGLVDQYFSCYDTKVISGLLAAYCLVIIIFSSQKRWDLRYHTAFPIIFCIDLIVTLALCFTIHKLNFQDVVICSLVTLFYQSFFIVNSFMIVKGVGYKYPITPKNVLFGCSELLFSGAFVSYCKFICKKKKSQVAIV
ncbi:hypothetical protein ACFFRR_008212 [Megaselia abdita]